MQQPVIHRWVHTDKVNQCSHPVANCKRLAESWTVSAGMVCRFLCWTAISATSSVFWVHQAASSGSHFLSTCGAIFSALPQYDMDVFRVLLLVWLRKDTNCQSELKPVFIYTGSHMFTSCSIVLVSNLTKATLSFYTLQSSTIWFTGHPSNKDMDWKKQTTLNGTKTHFGNTLTHMWNIWVIQARLIEHLFTINSTTSIITK